jgi:cytochrome b561
MMLKNYSNKLVALHWMTVPLIIVSLVMGTVFYTISAFTIMILEVLQKLFLTTSDNRTYNVFQQSHTRSGFSFIPNLH